MVPAAHIWRSLKGVQSEMQRKKKEILAAVDAEFVIMKVYYCFLQDDQIRGKTLKKLGIPSLFGGKIDWAKIGLDFHVRSKTADRAGPAAATKAETSRATSRCGDRPRPKTLGDRARPRRDEAAKVPVLAAPAPVSQAGRKGAANRARPKRRLLRVVSGDDVQDGAVLSLTPKVAHAERAEAVPGGRIVELDAFEPPSSPEDLNRASRKPLSLGVLAPKKDVAAARASRAALAAKAQALTRQLLQRRGPQAPHAAQASSEETQKGGARQPPSLPTAPAERRDDWADFSEGTSASPRAPRVTHKVSDASKRRGPPPESPAEPAKRSRPSPPPAGAAAPGLAAGTRAPSAPSALSGMSGKVGAAPKTAQAPRSPDSAFDMDFCSAPTQKIPPSPFPARPVDRPRGAAYPSLSLKLKKLAKAVSPPASIDDSDGQSTTATFVLSPAVDKTMVAAMRTPRAPRAPAPAEALRALPHQVAPTGARPSPEGLESSNSDTMIPSTQWIAPSQRVMAQSMAEQAESSDTVVSQTSKGLLLSQTVVPPSPPRQTSDEQSSDSPVIQPSQRLLSQKAASRSSRKQTSDEQSSDSVLRSSKRLPLSPTVVPPSPPRQTSDEQSSDFVIEPSQRLLLQKAASRSSPGLQALQALQATAAEQAEHFARADAGRKMSPVGRSPIIASGARKRRSGSSELASSQRLSLTPVGGRAVRRLFRDAEPKPTSPGSRPAPTGADSHPANGPREDRREFLEQPTPIDGRKEDDFEADQGDSDDDQRGDADTRPVASHRLGLTRSVSVASSRISAGDLSVGDDLACGRREEYVSLRAAAEQASGSRLSPQGEQDQQGLTRTLSSRRSSRTASPRRREEERRARLPVDSDSEDVKAARDEAVRKRREQREAREAASRRSSADTSRSASRAASIEPKWKKRSEQAEAALPVRSGVPNARLVVPPYPMPCTLEPSPESTRKSVSSLQLHGFRREQKPPSPVPPTIQPYSTTTDSSGQERLGPRSRKSLKMSVGMLALTGTVMPAEPSPIAGTAESHAQTSSGVTASSKTSASDSARGRRGVSPRPRPGPRRSVGRALASPFESRSNSARSRRAASPRPRPGAGRTPASPKTAAPEPRSNSAASGSKRRRGVSPGPVLRRRASGGRTSASPRTSTAESGDGTSLESKGSRRTALKDVTNSQAEGVTPRRARGRSGSAKPTQGKPSRASSKASIAYPEHEFPMTPRRASRAPVEAQHKSSASLERIVTTRLPSEGDSQNRDEASGLSDISLDDDSLSVGADDLDLDDDDEMLPPAPVPATPRRGARAEALPRRRCSIDLATKARFDPKSTSSPAMHPTPMLRPAQLGASAAYHIESSQSTNLGQDISSITISTISSGSSRPRQSVGVEVVVREGGAGRQEDYRLSRVARSREGMAPSDLAIASPRRADLSPPISSSEEADQTVTTFSNLYSPVP